MLNNEDGEHSPFSLTVGKRVPPYGLVRVADRKPVNLHDVLPSDGFTKLIVFAGSLTNPEEKDRLANLEKRLLDTLDEFGQNRFRTVVVLSGIGGDMSYMDVPVRLRNDWERYEIALALA